MRPLDGSGTTRAYELPCEHLVTHGCVAGATGSGKTGLLMVLVEEALRARVPVVMIDVKGDLPNLLSMDVAALKHGTTVRVLTPGTQAGEPVNVLSSLELPSPLWKTDPETAREALSASISLLLRLIGRDPDPTRSRDHVLLSIFAERRLRAGHTADVRTLLEDVNTPPIRESKVVFSLTEVVVLAEPFDL